ncbi:integrase [Terracoccus luteus]|uniref:Integrase n=1 Tax=Terracoccus luteus TaxID=53356 RepID=A0A839PWI2_9MICO|nr:integrase [Terracoccus luteus]MCP2174033.1 integrase [Terracoccus luteus]
MALFSTVRTASFSSVVDSTLRECCESYLEENPRVGERWAETCRRNMRLHLDELLDKPVANINPPMVRAWHAKALRGSGGRTSISQSYRLIRAVLNVAVQDGAIVRNPCQIPGAGAQRSAERPIATPAEVAKLIEATTPCFRAAVALAAWCGLRRGELCALRTRDVDLEHGRVTVRRNYVELLEAPGKFEKDPKSEAGKRTVTIPPHMVPLLERHACEHSGPTYFLADRHGQQVRGNTIYQAFVRAREQVGLTIAFHDLRHTGQSLAAATGASLVDLKKRLGHSSTAAAQRYMHAVEGRDAHIADALSKLAASGDASKLPKSF